MDVSLLFLLAAALIWPLFRLHYMDNWASIESTFIADGRFLKDHWPHPRWQPLWYCGTRFDYVYPPALRYGTATLAKVLLIDTARSYHIYTALFYCIGITGVYLLVRTGSGARGAAWLASAATALLSPSFAFMKHIRADAASQYLLPQRLNALVRYGEGPHMTAVALLPLALAAAWLGLRRNRPGALGFAALFCALVVSNNFYGATALAIFFPVLAWSLWITHLDHRIWLRAAAAAALAYGLTAFWLSPSYLRTTLRNMKLVSEPGNSWSIWLAAGVVIVFALVTTKAALRRPECAWPVFAGGVLTFIGLNVLGQYYFAFRIIGEPERMVPELDLAMILVAVEVLRRLWGWKPSRGPAWLPRALLCALVIFSFLPARHFVRHAWNIFPEDLNYRGRIEMRISEWMAHNLPHSRAVATGSVRFWYDAWHDLAQVGGGSDQGIENQNVIPGHVEVFAGQDPKLSILWMQALGADAVIVHDQRSSEAYHDYSFPQKFAGVLPVLYDSNEGDMIYKVPRRYPGLARVVDAAQFGSLPPVGAGTSEETLQAYVDVVENGPAAQAFWLRETTDRIRIHARLRQGQAILVQENYDPSWKAYSGDRSLRVSRDPLGFMLVDAPPGEQNVLLVFELPLENLLGRVASVLAGLILLGLFVAAWKGREARL